MELNLKQNEIEAALRLYVANQGINLAGRTVAVTFTSGRTANGLSALIDIGDVTEVQAVNTVQTPTHLGDTGLRTLELRQSDVQPQLASAQVTTTPVELAPEPDPDPPVELVEGQVPETVAEPTTESPAVGASLFRRQTEQ